VHNLEYQDKLKFTRLWNLSDLEMSMIAVDFACSSACLRVLIEKGTPTSRSAISRSGDRRSIRKMKNAQTCATTNNFSSFEISSIGLFGDPKQSASPDRIVFHDYVAKF